MIRSFRCRETKAIHGGSGSRRFRGIEEQARKRLRWLDAATSLADLAAIRGNRLEALQGDRAGQHAIRVNERWRVCFSWREGNAYDVEIVDYHRGRTNHGAEEEIAAYPPG
jgi:proteic killer suppression protein